MRSVDFLRYEGLTVTSLILGLIKWASTKIYKKKLSRLRDFEKFRGRNFRETGQKPRKRESFFQRKFLPLKYQVQIGLNMFLAFF